jgi:hypothetical protein
LTAVLTGIVTIATAITIAAPPDLVWAVLTDFACYAEWNPYLVLIEGSATAGTTIQVHACHRPDTPAVVQPVAVVAVAFPEMAWEGGLPDRSAWRGEHHFRVRADATGTHFDHFEHFSGSEAAGILAAHGDTIRANFTIFNLALKRRCAP